MSKITAKVVLNTMSHSIGSVGLSFSADYADGRNKEWAQATPLLDYKMTVRPEVAENFEVGGRYTVTFEPDDAQ